MKYTNEFVFEKCEFGEITIPTNKSAGLVSDYWRVLAVIVIVNRQKSWKLVDHYGFLLVFLAFRQYSIFIFSSHAWKHNIGIPYMSSAPITCIKIILYDWLI